MILVADAGNTNIKLGIYDHEKLLTKVPLETTISNTPYEYEQGVLGILRANKINVRDIEAVTVSTVVPEATKPFLDGMRSLFFMEPLVVNKDTKTGIEIKTDVPEELGADRLVNAAAAFFYYGGPILVIDFGTATTYDVITGNGEFLGGIIAPGIKICAEALWNKTAKLPKIEIEKPDKIMGTNTVNSMKSGVYYGYLGQIEYIVRHLKDKLATDFKVLATGGLSCIFEGTPTMIDVFDSELTLRGLNYIDRINRQQANASSPIVHSSVPNIRLQLLYSETANNLV